MYPVQSLSKEYLFYTRVNLLNLLYISSIHGYLVMSSVNLRSSNMWNMRSPPFTYSMTRNKCSLVWKLECKPVRNGGFFCSDKTCRSFSTPSTSSSSIIKSFFMLLMAYTSLVLLCSAKNTCERKVKTFHTESVPCSATLWTYFAKAAFS